MNLSTGWLAGWLAGRLVGRSVRSFVRSFGRPHVRTFVRTRILSSFSELSRYIFEGLNFVSRIISLNLYTHVPKFSKIATKKTEE
jgi:hypothetical protein